MLEELQRAPRGIDFVRSKADRSTTFPTPALRRPARRRRPCVRARPRASGEVARRRDSYARCAYTRTPAGSRSKLRRRRAPSRSPPLRFRAPAPCRRATIARARRGTRRRAAGRRRVRGVRRDRGRRVRGDARSSRPRCERSVFRARIGETTRAAGSAARCLRDRRSATIYRAVRRADRACPSVRPRSRHRRHSRRRACSRRRRRRDVRRRAARVPEAGRNSNRSPSASFAAVAARYARLR